MKIHFFQRYHSKENVDTANTMLLLSRLYSYSSKKYFDFLNKILPENAAVEMIFNLQEKSENSIPDATISQASFRIVAETKLYGNFGLEQLEHHLRSFKSEDYKVLLTLDPNPLNHKTKDDLSAAIIKYNAEKHSNIIHQHLTFEELASSISYVIDERDYEMQDILDDYTEYCYASGLIPNDWKRMRVQLAGTTLSSNKRFNLYYDNAERGFSGHKYLGLYNQKAVRAIGEIIAIVTAISNGSVLEFKTEKGELTLEMQERIKNAIEDAKNYGYNLESIKHRYFFVSNFYETLFCKSTLHAPMGSRMFDLCDVLGMEQLPNTEMIAELLRTKTWA